MSDPLMEARAALAAIDQAQGPEHAEHLRAVALIAATLAVAEEQRTANIIALAAEPSAAAGPALLRRAVQRVGGLPEVTR